MKAVVFAYHNIGIIGLEELIENGYDVTLVITHIDNPDENRWYGSVADWCQRKGIPCKAVDDVNDPECVRQIGMLKPDFIFSFYCRTLLKPALLAIPKMAAYNLHGSLLPTYRGCAPVNWVLINGEKETGVTLHRMVAKADAGDIIGQERVPIVDSDTALSLYGKIESASRILLARELPHIRDGNATETPQDLSLGSYYQRRTPKDGQINWQDSAHRIYNLIRAVTTPYPGAFTFLESQKMIVWWATVDQPRDLAPGQIKLDEVAHVGTGEGSIILREVEYNAQKFTGHDIVQLLTNRDRSVTSIRLGAD